MGTSLILAALVLGVSVIFAIVSIIAFILGVRYGTKQQSKVKTELKIVEVEKPFVVKQETVREVTTPGFIYPKPGTPNEVQDAADRKMQEIITEPEL